MSQIIINGKIYNGNSVTVINNKVIIDGIDQTPDSKQIKIEVNGNVDSLNIDMCDNISITGDCNEVKSSTGDINIDGSVSGNVKSSTGDVKIGGNVGGNVKTSTGDIKYRK